MPMEANKEMAKTDNATVWSEKFMSIYSFQANLYLPRALGLIPNPPKRWSLALTQGMMGKGRRTGPARSQ